MAIMFSGADLFWQFLCVIILNLGQQFRRRCHLKMFSIFCSDGQNRPNNFGSGSSRRTSLRNYFEFASDQIQKLMFFYLQFWWPVCSEEPNSLSNLVGAHISKTNT